MSPNIYLVKWIVFLFTCFREDAAPTMKMLLSQQSFNDEVACHLISNGVPILIHVRDITDKLELFVLKPL